MILGIDVSKWQKEMNWAKASLAGAKFAFIRAGSIDNVSGNCYTDYQFDRNADLAPDLMPVGYYWYFRPNHESEKQADYFCDLISEKKQSMPMVMDLEDNGGWGPVGVTNSAAAFALKVYERMDILPLLYSRAYWLNANTVPDPFMKLMELWIARYTSKGKPWGNILPWPDSPSIKPRDYDTWYFWQWSDGGNGRGAEFGAQSKSIDLNYFNGDEAAFEEYIGVEPQEYTFPPSIGIKANIEVEGVDVKYQGHIEKVE